MRHVRFRHLVLKTMPARSFCQREGVANFRPGNNWEYEWLRERNTESVGNRRWALMSEMPANPSGLRQTILLPRVYRTENGERFGVIKQFAAGDSQEVPRCHPNGVVVFSLLDLCQGCLRRRRRWWGAFVAGVGFVAAGGVLVRGLRAGEALGGRRRRSANGSLRHAAAATVSIAIGRQGTNKAIWPLMFIPYLAVYTCRLIMVRPLGRPHRLPDSTFDPGLHMKRPSGTLSDGLMPALWLSRTIGRPG